MSLVNPAGIKWGFMQRGARKGGILPWLVVPVLTWTLFLVHSCTLPPITTNRFVSHEDPAFQKIRVGLGQALRTDAVTISIEGPFKIIYGETGTPMYEDGPLSNCRITAEGGTLKMGSLGTTPEMARLAPLTDSSLWVAGRRYHGSLILHAEGSKVTAVNEVDLESYLKGVVGMEMKLSWPQETLKAQAISARSYALYEHRNQTLQKIKGEKFDLYDDEQSQVYGGMTRETDLARRLVGETRGQVVTYNGRILKALYSSTCGGHTDPGWQILREGEKMPPMEGTACPFCQDSPHYRWKADIPKSDLIRRLFPDRPGVAIRSIRITSRAGGGHALKLALRLDGIKGEVPIDAYFDFRRIDPKAIKSTLFEEILDLGDRIRIVGRGWGHGCGLCQYGAMKMGKIGKTATQILEFYYPGATVTQVY